MLNFIKNILCGKSSTVLEAEYIAAPLSGKVVNITEVPDPVFSNRMMGDGFAIIPNSGDVVSPIEGTVESIFPTKHAIGLRSKNGYEILIHFGLETVNLNGEGFEVFVEIGQQVKVGEKLLKVDLKAVSEKVPDTITSIIVANLAEGESISIVKLTDVHIGEEAIAVIKKQV